MGRATLHPTTADGAGLKQRKERASAPPSRAGRPARGVWLAALFVACAAGWCVMELEVLGTRLLTPYFGSELYVVMGSVIGVFLLSLSAGYMGGGWLSARRRSAVYLGLALVAAGGWFALIPVLQAPVCERLFDAVPDVRWGSLLAALALFAVPTALLGTVSPTVVRWLTRDAQRAGVSAGLVLGLSTVASFAGCIVTTFFLVIRSMRATLRTTGALLAALGLIVLLAGLWQARRRRRLFGKEPT